MDGTVGNVEELCGQAVTVGEENQVVLHSDVYSFRMGSDRFRKGKEECWKRLND